MKIIKKITIELEVEINGKYSKGSPGSFYNSNGDPGDPPEYPEYEIHSVTYDKKDITEMLESANFDWQQLEEEIIQDIENYDGEYDND